MAQEIKPTIKVDTGESQKTVKSLKKEISDLKDQILNLTKGTKEYDDAVEQLQANQRQLDEVMALTKKTATALDNSYDALTHQMSLLKKEWRATADETKRAQIGEEISKINTQLKELDAEIGNYQRNVGNYVSHWEGMPEVTRDFGAALKESNQTIEPTKQGLEGLGNLVSGLAAGFAAVQGAAALLGVENKKLEETFIKLQSAIALTQGISGMKGLFEGASKLSAFLGVSVKTFGIWGAAIAAVATALYAVFKNLPMVKDRQAAWDAQIKNSIENQKNFQTSIENANTALEKRVEILKAQGTTEKEILQIQIDNAKKASKDAWSALMAAQSKKSNVKSDAETLTGGAFKQIYGMNKSQAQKHYQELEDKATEFYNEQQAAYEGYLHQMDVLVEKEKAQFGNRLTNMEDALKSEEQRLKEQYEKDLKMAEQYGYDTIVIVKKYQADLKALREKNKKDSNTPVLPILDDVVIEDEPIKVDDTAPKMQEEGEYYKQMGAAMAAVEKTYYQLAIKNGEDVAKYEIEIEERKLERLKELHQQAIDNKDYSSQVLLSQEIADQEVEITRIKNEKILEDEERTKERRKQIINEVSQALSAAGSVAQGILEITQAAAEKDKKITEQEAKRIKGMQIAVATMNMLAGITAALSGAFTTKTGPWDIALAAIQAATIAASGTANIMKIKNTDLTGSVPSGAMGAVTPNSNIYGTDIPFSYTRQVTGQSEMDALNQDTRVYILESDIQASNKKVQVRENESTF